MKNLILSAAFLAAANCALAQGDSSQFYLNKGLEEKAASHWLVAAKHFDKAIQLDPKNSVAYAENGFVNLEMRKTDPAKLNFTRAHELDPSNKAVIKELMELSYNYRQWAKAIEYAEKCATCEGSARIIALSNYQLEDYGKAEKGLLQALKVNENDAQVNYILAKTYIEMEAYPKAIPYFQKAVDLDPNKLSWIVELADEYYDQQRYKDAVKYYSLAIDKGYTANNDFKTDMAFSYIYSGEYQKGEDMIAGVIAKNPGKTDLYMDVADAFYNRKVYDKALDYCQKLLEINMKDSKALYKAGLCFQKKGEKDRGQAMCDKAIELDPSLAGLKKQTSFAAGL